MMLTPGDLIERKGARWLVLDVIRNVATIQNEIGSRLNIPANVGTKPLLNVFQEWVLVPVKRTGPSPIVCVEKPHMLRGGEGGTTILTAYRDWIEAGAGIYVAPSVGLLLGDILICRNAAGKTIQVRIRSLSTIVQKIQRAREPTRGLETAFDRLMQDEDDD